MPAFEVVAELFSHESKDSVFLRRDLPNIDPIALNISFPLELKMNTDKDFIGVMRPVYVISDGCFRGYFSPEQFQTNQDREVRIAELNNFGFS